MMKHLLIASILLIGLQADAIAQHRMQHRSSRHHRMHYHRSRHHSGPYDRAYNGSHRSDDQPSAYKGDNTPINDGQRKNKQRNLNYNTNQPLPASNGK